jgi:hypothetical protein
MNKRNKKAGKAVASGSFGCVFRPPLRCKGEVNRPGTVDKPLISKLMIRESALEEYKIIQDVKNSVKDIPNYGDYFVLDDITMCDPGELDEEDMENAVKECKSPLKLGNNETTISSNKLSQTSIITAPDMGNDIHKSFIQMNTDMLKYKGNDKLSLVSKNLKKFNIQIVKLLKNGIAPMIEKGIYHNDLKAENIMTSYKSLEDVKNNFNYVKMVDFGFLTKLNEDADEYDIEESLVTNLLFNTPIYNLIYDELLLFKFTKKFEELLPNVKTRFNDLKNGEFQIKLSKEIQKILFNDLKLQRESHWYFLESFYNWCVANNSYEIKIPLNLQVTILLTIAFGVIIDLTEEDGRVSYRREDYFNDIIRNNIDIVGVLSSYSLICQIILNDVKNEMKDVVTAYANMLYDYIFSTKYVQKAISISELVKEIENINNLLNKYDKYYVNNSNTNKNLKSVIHKSTIIKTDSNILKPKTKKYRISTSGKSKKVKKSKLNSITSKKTIRSKNVNSMTNKNNRYVTHISKRNNSSK